MTLEEQLKELIEALDRVHPDGFFLWQCTACEHGLPDFATAQNGNQRHFPLSARKALRGVAAEPNLWSLNSVARELIGRSRFSKSLTEACESASWGIGCAMKRTLKADAMC
jgi:hypothetical protein